MDALVGEVTEPRQRLATGGGSCAPNVSDGANASDGATPADRMGLGWLRAHLKPLLQTGAASGVATVADYILYVALVELFAVHYVVAATVTSIFGMALIFVLNKLWIFREAKGGMLGQLVRYCLATLLGGAAVIGCLYLLVDSMGLPYWLGLIVANLIVFPCWTYPTNRFVVFPHSQTSIGETRKS